MMHRSRLKKMHNEYGWTPPLLDVKLKTLQRDLISKG